MSSLRRQQKGNERCDLIGFGQSSLRIGLGGRLDSSFATIADHPYLYYVRLDDNHGPYQRTLVRQRIKLDWLVKQPAGEATAHRTTP